MAESIIIVGNAASLHGRGLGEVIDSHDVVFRFPVRRYVDARDFGTKTTYLVSSWRSHADVISDDVVPSRGTFIMIRPGQDTPEAMEQMRSRLGKYNPDIATELWPWMHRMKEIGAKGYIDPRQGELGQLPGFSRGSGACIIACNRLHPKRIDIIGLDNLWAGRSENYTNVFDAARGTEHRTTPHDMAAERQILDELMEHYNVEIRPV